MDLTSDLVDRFRRWTALCAAFAVAFSFCLLILGYQGNLLTGVARVAAAICFTTAVISPRVMLYGLVVMATCLDTVKRLLGVFGSFSENDLAIVLTIAPLTLGGVFVGLISHRIFRHGKILAGREWFLFLCALGTMGGSFSKAFVASRSVLRAGQSVTDGTAYLLVPLVIVGLLHDARAANRFLRFISWAFLPVALYGVVQFYFGFQEFELDYMRSGLSASIIQFDDVRIRIFSTLNSGHAFGVVMAMMLVLTVAQAVIHRRNRASLRVNDILLVTGYASGLTLCFGRTSWAQGILGIVGIFFFTSARRTKIFYGAALAVLATVLLNSEYILGNLEELESKLPTESALQQQAFRLGTYSDRLVGLMNVANDSSYWTPFGVDAYVPGEVQHGDRYFAHDAFTDALLRYGYVGVLFLAGICIYFLVLVHRSLLSVKNRDLRTLGAALTSACFSIFFSGFLSGSSLHVYPVNLLFWSFVGCILVISSRNPKEPDAGERVIPAGAAMPALGRPTRVPIAKAGGVHS